MRKMLLFLMFCLFFSVCLFQYVMADKKPPEQISLTLEGAKLPPVNFFHITHVEKAKLECVVCHHKDKNPQEPEACVKCHPLKEPQNNAPIAKDAFHKQCITCHNESALKGTPVPTKCNECHKKQ